jgi:hypothetical protein
MAIIQGTSKASSGSYQIDQSIRFNDNDTAKLTRTPASAGNRKTWTWSGWVKRGNLGDHIMFGTGTLSGTANDMVLWFNGSDQIAFYRNSVYILRTNAVYRDPSAWYHIVLHIDTTNATATDRQRLWVNGEEVTDFNLDNNLALNTDYPVNNTIQHALGQTGTYGSSYYDGYMAEINFIDGQALAPIDFGEYNDDGVWIAKRFAGAYGSNGFYITGEDSAALGTDYSGNGNDFTSSGLTAADQMLDTPTDNYPVFSPINKSTNITLSDGNLLASSSGTSDTFPVIATICPESSKWYAEFEMVEADNTVYVGVGNSSETARIAGATFTNVVVGRSAGYQNGVSYRNGTGDIWTGGSSSAYGNTFTTNDIIGVALDADTGSVWFSKNGTFQNSGNPAAGTGAAVTGLTGPFCFSMSITTTDDVRANFGQSAFTYTPPTGFKALSTANLPAPAIKDGSKYFQTTLYTGNGATQSITGVPFQPDLVWVKSRSSAAENWAWFDSVRGATKRVSSSSAATEGTDANSLTAFNADGFDVGTSAWSNINAATYAAWQWLANGSGSSNTDGATSSTVSANQTAGFSVVTYTGTGSATTIGHGLGVVPQFIAIKSRTYVESWGVYPGTSTGYGGQYRLKLNEPSSVAASSGFWNNTDATSSVFSLGTELKVNKSGENHVAYCWAEVAGYSKIGRYTGNGSSDGPFVWCGFRPAFVTIKYASGVDSWYMWDTQRSPYNQMDDRLVADLNAAEVADRDIDFVSNGFKIREANSAHNASGGTYIYLAFAEFPLGGDGVAPATAR